MSHIPQPEFWLTIRKEYIIENFEKLLSYIRRYQYLGDKDSNNGEFLNTCRYLTDLAEELSAYSLSSSFLSVSEFKLSTSDTIVPQNLAFRIIVASILASKKIGKDEHAIILRLINLLVVCRKMPHADSAESLVDVVCNCVRGVPVTSFGMKWVDIEDPATFSPLRLLHNICQTKFDDTVASPDCFFEGKGTVMFTQGVVAAAPVNKVDFMKAQLNTYLAAGRNVSLLLPKSDRMKTPDEIEDVADGMTFMTRAQGAVKPSVVEVKKYAPGALLMVVVTSNYGVKIEAESIDTAYSKIAGKISINLVDSLRYSDTYAILSKFRPGLILLVEYTPGNPEIFSLRKGFDQFYMEFANQALGDSVPAVYIGDYSAGSQWLTDEGFVVNVMGKQTNSDVLYAMEEHIPLTVRMSGTREQNGNVLVNGTIVDDIEVYGLGDPVDDMETYLHECYVYIFEKFIEYCIDLMPEKSETALICDTNSEGASVIANILVERQRRLSDTMPRLFSLQAALMLAIAAGDYAVGAYIRHELEYQIAVARFAGGASPMSISLTHGPNLDGIPEVEKHERIIAMIRNYKEPELLHADERITDDEMLEDTVDGLIDASNRLLGKIDDREISRIKFELAKVLDVDDQFKSTDQSTFYGVESDTLEFKSSAVCPPRNRQKNNVEYEPDTQKWAILKTVCGFLNSISGGELLIGVRDNGLACGIERDCQLLFADRRIPEPNADRFRTYIKNIIDNSFFAYKSRAEKSSVTTAYITYDIEKNNEGLEIIRVRVESYRGDMVRFHPDCDRPEEVNESYIRTSGATVPMTTTVRDQTLSRKYHLAGDREGVGMAAVYEARNSKKRVLLKEYTSHTGVGDHEVEVFKVFPESKCILAYDTKSRDVRLFKSTRWKDARITDKNCTQSSVSAKRDLQPDIFGFVFDPSKTSFKVDVALTNYGAILLREEYPASEGAISASGKRDFPWTLSTEVNTLDGVARFVRGLPNECHVDPDSVLASYLL